MFVIKDRVRERKYYKYSYDSWTQPTISGNGTIGVDNFAVFEEYLTTIFFVFEAALYLLVPANLMEMW